MFEKIQSIVKAIKRDQPLVLNITNFVTMDFVANGLLSLGASPIMSYAEQELEELVALAAVVVINPGTLNDEFVTLCKKACHIANQLKKPIILDPVGAGASHYRTSVYKRLLDEFAISIIRGNASEVMALAGAGLITKGVDSSIESQWAIQNAQELAIKNKAVIVVSGKMDVIVDACLVEKSHHGSALMCRVTGTGCLLSAVVAAFHAVHDNAFEAAVAATYFYGVCGELAEKKTSLPGSFKTCFIDTLSLTPTREHYEKN